MLLILELTHVRISLLHPLAFLRVGSKYNQLEDKRSALHLLLCPTSLPKLPLCLENSPVDYQNSLTYKLTSGGTHQPYSTMASHTSRGVICHFIFLSFSLFLPESCSSPGVSLVHVSCIPTCTHAYLLKRALLVFLELHSEA